MSDDSGPDAFWARVEADFAPIEDMLRQSRGGNALQPQGSVADVLWLLFTPEVADYLAQLGPVAHHEPVQLWINRLVLFRLLEQTRTTAQERDRELDPYDPRRGRAPCPLCGERPAAAPDGFSVSSPHGLKAHLIGRRDGAGCHTVEAARELLHARLARACRRGNVLAAPFGGKTTIPPLLDDAP